MKHFLVPVLMAFTSVVSAQTPSYWQQKVDTKIDVTLDDKKHMLRGFEEFSYINNSPDTLRYIYVHLWPNAYKHDHTQFAEQQYRNGTTDFYFAKPGERGFIDSLQFSVNGNDVEYFYGESTPDIGRIDLPRPLPPGEKIIVTTPFRVKIPKVFSRLGHTGQSYYISQWFPKPAVYDRKGWHPMPYLDLGEFYSEIGSYEVNITLPKNYVVIGTGNIQNEEENNWLDSLASLPIDTTGIKTKQKIPESAAQYKTISFREDNIHDFAWFADKRWTVRRDTVASPGTGEVITIWSAFFPSYHKQWSNANKHLRNAVKYYGKWVGPYPYKTIKAVQGDLRAGGGMEYPTVTILDRNAGQEEVIIHEAGHNWFYGILASNERDHAWMDEGLNTFYERKTIKELNRPANAEDSITVIKKTGGGIELSPTTIIYQLAASAMDQAIDQTSNNFKEINYGMDVYYKTGMMLTWLEGYMGAEAFQRGMHEYYDTWKHRHPYPDDFRAVMQKHTDKSLDWFFESALKTDKLVDFSVKKVKRTGDKYAVTIKNRTGLAFPAGIEIMKGDSILTEARSTTDAIPEGGMKVVVIDGSDAFTGTKTLYFSKEFADWDRVRIAQYIPDGRTPNNAYRRTGLFHRSGLTTAPFVGTNLSSKQKLFIMPALGYNLYDGFEAGLLLHNLTWPETKFKYIIAPLYGFRTKEFIGAGSLGYSIYPEKVFKDILIQTDVKSFSFRETWSNITEPMFARYIKITPSLNFTFKEAVFTSPVTRTLTLKGYAISEEDFDFTLDVSDSLYKPTSVTAQQNYYGLARYRHKNDRTFNPFSYSVEGQIGEHFAKLNLEGNLRIDYHAKNKALHIRGFAGKFFDRGNSSSRTSRYLLNSTFTGPNDYLYDDTYVGRSEREGFGARQVSIREGGFKIPTPLLASPIGRSESWLFAVNLKSDLPLKWIPARLYLDIGSFTDADKLNPSGNRVLYNGGFEIYIMDVLNIYIPVVASSDFKDYQKGHLGKNRFLKSISFSLNLQNINWLKAPSGVFKIFGY